MFKKLLFVVANIQSAFAPVPYINYFSQLDPVNFLCAIGVVIIIAVAIISWLIISTVNTMNRAIIHHTIRKFFGERDLKNFNLCRMGRPRSKYYTEEGFNSFSIGFPHWRYKDENGCRQKRLFNKIVYEESILWLYAGAGTYVLSTNDPYDMVFLVHTLREDGYSIAPCVQELERQEKRELEKRNCNENLRAFIEQMDGDSSRFTEFCRQRLITRGFEISDAPRNNDGIEFFLKSKSIPMVVKCMLLPCSTLIGVNEVQEFKKASENLFVEAGMLITTGKISVAAAGYAKSHGIEIICDERLIALATEDKDLPPELQFRYWELTYEDIQKCLPQDLLGKM